MSNYPNGQPYYPSHGQGSQYPSQTQGQGQGQVNLHRTSSFNAGDDARFFDQSQAQAQSNASYHAPYGGAPAAQPLQQPYTSAATNQTSLPYRSTSYGYSVGGYQHQYQNQQMGNVTYNPAQYQPHTYNPQAYSPPQPQYHANSYQPYVPSAYQDPTANRYNTTHNNYHTGSPQQYGHPPMLPSRPGDAAYGSQPSAYSGYQHQPQIQQPYGQGTTYTSGNHDAASPPAPPPPPPHHESSTTRPYTHSVDPGYEQPAYSTHGTSNMSSLAATDIHRNYSSASHASQVSTISSSLAASSQPSLPTPPTRNTSLHSPQRSNTQDRHPQGHALPGLPSESESDTDYFVPHHQGTSGGSAVSGYEDLMSHLDAAINHGNDPLFDNTGHTGLSPDEKPTHLNGIVSTGDHNINYGAFTNDSDAEAAAGLAAMQAADEQEAAEEQRRRSSNITSTDAASRMHLMDRSDDSDYAGYDLSLAGGGYAGTMSYGNEEVSHYAAAAAAMPAGDYSRLNPRMDSVRSTGMSSDGRGSQTSGYDSIPASESVHPFPPLRTDIARVDTGGTGGLTEPNSALPRRRSYDDGDEADMIHEKNSPFRESLPDLFFHPGMSPHRPLPPPPSQSDPGSRLPHLVPAGTSPHQTRFSQYDSVSQTYPSAPDAFSNQAQQTSIGPRSTSMASNRTVSKPDQPIRSKTDADRARISRTERTFSDVYEVTSPESGVALDLPTLPRKKFNPGKISSEQFRKCSAPWALSAILSWIKDLAEDEIDLKEHAISEAVVALFTHKVPTMNTTEAEALGDLVVEQMLEAKALVKDEEWVKFGTGDISGVLYQLTGSGCYSSKLHLYPAKGRCYSNLCMRTLKKVDLTLPSERTSEDWITYYKLTKEDIDKHDKKEIERQMNQHEIVTGEDNYIAGLDLLRILYRDQIQSAQPPLLPAKKLPGFIRDVFGFVDKVKKVNEDFLLAQLKYRQNEQGPFIVGFSDIFREWIRRARNVYVEYANAYPKADYLVRREAERNAAFKQLLDQCRQDPRAKRLSWDNYLKSPIQRLQRYGLLLDTVMKNMKKDSTEKVNLAMAIDEIKSATHDANQAYARAEKDMELLELGNKIKLRKTMEVVELNLDHKGRQIHMRGDLQRSSGRGFQMVDTHAILFDHYLVLAKTLVSRDSAGARKQEQYDVSKTPIPMDLISLVSTNEPAVVKSSVKGIATVTTTVGPRGQVPDPRLNRTTSNNSGGTLQHTNSGFSAGSSSASGNLVPTTSLTDISNRDDKVMYPFKVKHLGKADVYTLYASSAELREQWCSAIIFAKEQHAEALHAQNAEPFKLRVLADTAFGTEGSTAISRGALIRDTPLHRAVQESEKRYAGNGRPAPICRAGVNCATVFQQPHGKFMCAVGTDYGVYISEFSNPRGWIRVIQMVKVTQIAVLEEFNLFLLISDKVLIAYHLDVVCPASGPTAPQNDSSMRKAPQKLSGAKDVAFFQTGRMKDRALVFYKKRDGLNSVFKVLEPVLQKSATTRSRFLPTSSRRGQTDFFREYDEFYIPTECYSINIFNSSLGVSTSRGFEVLTLDKKLPWTVPNLQSEMPDTQAHLSSIAARIKDLKPLGMFRLSQSEFLVTFDECAVYVNQHGDISRGVVMEFVGRAKSACLYEQYLILCDDDFVEIRDAQNGRLKQVIAGKEMKMIDDGGNLMPGTSQQRINTSATLGGGANGLGVQGFQPVPRSVKLCMLHPEYEKSYVLVELLFATDTDKE